jgi:hypothetical protein
MFNVTSQFKALALSNSRAWQIYATIDASTIYQANIVDFTLEDSLTSDGYVVWGNGPSRKLTIKFNGLIPIEQDDPIKLFVGLNNEYIELGTFYIEMKDTVYSNISTTVVAYDTLVGLGDIKFEDGIIDWSVLTMSTLKSELSYYMTFDSTGVPSFPTTAVSSPIKGSARDALYDLAELDGRVVKVHPQTGEILMPYFDIPDATAVALTPAHYINFLLTSPQKISIDTIESNGYSAGGSSYGTYSIDNVNLTSAIVDSLATAYLPIEYYAYTLELQGLPHIQVGDLIALTDVYDDTYELVVGTHILTYNGTLKSEISAAAPSNSIVSMNRSTKPRVDYSNEAINDAINSLIVDVAANAPSPIPAGADLSKLYLTINDKLYILQLIANGYTKYTLYNDELSTQHMFYIAAGDLKDAFDAAYADISGIATLYPEINEVDVLNEMDLEDIVDLNEKITAYNSADRNLAAYLLLFFKNETGNTIIDNQGVHIGTFQTVPTVNDDESYYDVGGLEHLFTVNNSSPSYAVITSTDHELIFGDIIYVITDGTLPTGMITETKYWVNPLTTATFNIAESESDLVAGTYVITTTDGSGNHAYYTGGANSRLTSSALEFRYGNKVKVSVESEKTKVVNAELNGVSVVNNEITLPEQMYVSDVLDIQKKGSGIRINFL